MPVKPSLAVPTELYFGAGRAAELPEIVLRHGRRIVLVTGVGRLADLAREIADRLGTAGGEVTTAAVVDREPTLAMVDGIAATLRATGAEVVVGLGGGSCLDAAKAAAVLATAGRPAADFFQTGAAPNLPGLPWVAVPTTAGSGAEVTPNAVLIDQANGVKQSIRGGNMFARAAVVDPDLTVDLPPAQTVYSGMDALSHAVEALASKGANELTDILAFEAARLIQAHLHRVHADGGDTEARSAMARASLLAGIALANARLGAVHGLAHPLGVLYNLPHGLVCAVLLPQVMRFNLRTSYEKYARLAQIWGVVGGGDEFDQAAAAIRHLLGLNRRLGLPASLAALGLREADLSLIVRQTLPSGSLAANPRPAGEEELLALLRENL